VQTDLARALSLVCAPVAFAGASDETTAQKAMSLGYKPIDGNTFTLSPSWGFILMRFSADDKNCALAIKMAQPNKDIPLAMTDGYVSTLDGMKKTKSAVAGPSGPQTVWESASKNVTFVDWTKDTKQDVSIMLTGH
jgi:hypothetical protein